MESDAFILCVEMIHHELRAVIIVDSALTLDDSGSEG